MRFHWEVESICADHRPAKGRGGHSPAPSKPRSSCAATPGPLRQIAIAGLGHDNPTLQLTNHPDAEPAARLADRYPRRMVIENCIRKSIDFFHLDELSAAVPIQIDVDLQFTLMASTLYRLVARRIGNGHEKTEARKLFDRFARTAAKVRILSDRIEVRLGQRAHNPLLIAAGFGDGENAIPWLDNRQLRIVIGYDKRGAPPAEDRCQSQSRQNPAGQPA